MMVPAPCLTKWHWKNITKLIMDLKCRVVTKDRRDAKIMSVTKAIIMKAIFLNVAGK